VPLRRNNQAAIPAKKQAGIAASNKAHARRSTKSARYTPPTPKTKKQSKLWLPAAMFTCLVLGVIVLAGNYMELLPGGEVSNNNLLIGLVLLVSGFVLSTFYR
jgi:hypothetical protein